MTPPKKDITKPNTEADIERDIAIGTDFTELQSLNDANGAIDPDGFEAEIANAEEAEQVLAEETQRPAPESTTARNRRIAKNTLMLYIRMGITFIIGLYTSRVVLNVLGVTDYGINAIVGSVTGLMTFLNATMSGATSRFFSFSLGEGDKEKIYKTFSSALFVHVIIALIFLFLAETIGLYIVECQLVIPPDKMHAARWVYQLSIIGGAIGIIQTPFTGCVIAHERLTFYAYLTVFNSLLKLLIVYLLLIGNFNKLILYAILGLAVTIISAAINISYCRRCFPESRKYIGAERSIMKQVLSFAGYNAFGNIGTVVNTQATNFVINIFYGVVYNAAVGIATTISSVVNMFSANITTAFRPAIIKAYAQNDIASTQKLEDSAMIISTFLVSVVFIPIVLNLDYILVLWLKIVPYYTTIFATIILLDLFFLNIRYTLTVLIHANGKVVVNSTICGVLYILNPVVTYALFKLGFPAYYAFIGNIVINIILTIIYLILIKSYISTYKVRQTAKAIFIPILLTALTAATAAIATKNMHGEFSRLIISTLFSTILLTASYLVFAVNKEQRALIAKTLHLKILNW